MATVAIHNFRKSQEIAQGVYFRRTLPEFCGFGGKDYRLSPQDMAFNLEPSIREAALAYFDKYGIAWHMHANHALSSQICCLNFLMPLATRPHLLADLVQKAIGGPAPEMLPVEDGPQGEPWFVGFEWIGKADYLNEWPASRAATRGANVTSADAVVRFRQAGKTETLLIEWKYIESYGNPIDPKGNTIRAARYKDLMFAPTGPIKPDSGVKLEDFFWEPFYQNLRQQMLALQMERAGEDGAELVRVLHVSPADNLALKKMTSPNLQPFGSDASSAFRSLLVRPENFLSTSPEEWFGEFVERDKNFADWAGYLHERYDFLQQDLVDR